MVSDDSVIVTAPSVEEAIILGLTRLTTTREEVDIEVLDEGSKGFLGIGSREAKVRLTRRQEPRVVRDVPAPEPIEEETPAPETGPVAAETVEPISAAEPAEEAVSEPAAPEISSPAPTQAVEAPPEAAVKEPVRGAPEPETAREDSGLDRSRLEGTARDIASHLLPNIDVEVSIEWVEEDRPTLWISLEGKDADSLVGPRARNLHAVQYLFRSLIYHELDGEYNVVVDADGYRRRRRRSIESLAEEKAARALELGRTVRLRPMPAHERRIVHITLRKDDRVSTESVGRGRDRAVTIIPTKSGGRSGRS